MSAFHQVLIFQNKSHSFSLLIFLSSVCLTYLFLSPPISLSYLVLLSVWLMGNDRIPQLRFLIPETCRHTGAVNRCLLTCLPG